MADMDELFGLGGTTAEVPAPDPSPRKPRKSASAADPVVQAEASKDAKAEQDRILAAEAAELADLHQRVQRAGQVAGPETGDEARAVTPVEHVIARWNSYSAPEKVTQLGLPAGARLRAQPLGETGVEVLMKVPAGTVLPAVGRAVVEAVRRWAWGDYRAAPVDATSLVLTREIVGDDPATPWRAAGKTAFAVFSEQRTSNGVAVSRRVWERAGLTVKTPEGKVLAPSVLERALGDRGPELLLKLPGGLSAENAAKTQASLASLFRCKDLVAAAEGTHLRIKLNTKPPQMVPQMVPLWPSSLYRPISPEQAIAVGKRIALPVGVTLRGDRLERIEIQPAKVPHGVLVGSPGSGKSRWVRSAMTAWTVGGGLLAIGDPKNGELVQDWLPGCVHISTSKATIYRLLLWAQTEMKRRLAVQSILQRRHGVSDLPVQPILVVIDEFGQLMTELEQSTDPADKLARSEVERVVTNAMQVGRSVGIHLLLITQNALAGSLPGGIAQAASFRVSVGRPTEGAAGSGSVGRLFPAAMRDRAAELGATIETGSRGMLLTDCKGEPVLARAFFGYTPGEEPDDAKFTDLPAEIRDSWAQMRDALQHIPPAIRFGWRPGPDAPDDWPALSLSAGPKGDWPTVAVLKPVPLDRLDYATGRPVPIPEHAAYDPLSDAYEGGFDPIDLGSHYAPKSY